MILMNLLSKREKLEYLYYLRYIYSYRIIKDPFIYINKIKGIIE